MRTVILLVVAGSLLAGCDASEAPPAPSVSPSAEPEAEAVTPGPVPTETAATPALAAAAMPLEPGVYNQVGGDCEAIALAGLATFTGTGFGGRSSTECRFEPTSHEGNVWSGTQTCTDTYSKERRTDPLTIRVESPTRFVREDAYGRAAFALCPNEKLADWGG